MQNAEGDYVDLYIPRKCYDTNRLLDAKDHASVQISIKTTGLENVNPKRVDEKGNLTCILSGFIRSKGNSDAALNRFLYENKVISFY